MNTVLMTDTRSADARSAAAFLRERGYEVVAGDGVCLWDEENVRALDARIGGRLVGVIHPAPPRILALCEDADDEQWARAREEGPVAALIVAKVFGERMAREGGGALIYLGSIHAEKPVGGGFLFSIGCGATQMLCREASQDFGSRGVRSFYIERGPEDGERNDSRTPSLLYRGVSLRYPRREALKPGELNGLLAFLLTEDAWPLNGASLRADGGMTMFYGHCREEEGVRYVQR